MSDIDTVWSNDSARGDYVVAGADLQSGRDLMTAVLISLFSDRLARADDIIPDGTTDRRGWWGDTGESALIGSRLWLLERSKLTQAVALKAQQYAAEGLQWMIDDGVVAVFEFATQIVLPNQLRLTVTAYRTRGTVAAKKYAWVWSGNVLSPPVPPAMRPAIVTEQGFELVTEDGTVITA